MLQAMRYGSPSKLALASGVGVSALNKFPASKQQTRNDETTYGMNVTHYTSPFGSLNLVYHRLLEGTKYGGYIVILDMDEVAYRYLANDTVSRDTKLLPNRQPNDQDGRKDECCRRSAWSSDGDGAGPRDGGARGGRVRRHPDGGPALAQSEAPDDGGPVGLLGEGCRARPVGRRSGGVRPAGRARTRSGSCARCR
jgi:hypothetical protein